jgi:replicative DNA helicase
MPEFFPFSTEEECAFLGSLLRRPALDRRGRLRPASLPGLHPRDFRRPAHRLIWEAMVALACRRLPLTPEGVCRELAARGSLGAAGGADYLAALARRGDSHA